MESFGQSDMIRLNNELNFDRRTLGSEQSKASRATVGQHPLSTFPIEIKDAADWQATQEYAANTWCRGGKNEYENKEKGQQPSLYGGGGHSRSNNHFQTNPKHRSKQFEKLSSGSLTPLQPILSARKQSTSTYSKSRSSLGSSQNPNAGLRGTTSGINQPNETKTRTDRISALNQKYGSSSRSSSSNKRRKPILKEASSRSRSFERNVQYKPQSNILIQQPDPGSSSEITNKEESAASVKQRQASNTKNKTGTFGGDQHQKTKSNTEIFQELLRSALELQKQMFHNLDSYNQHLKQPHRLNLGDFPIVNKKSRSFKEIAESLLKQQQFCFANEIFSGSKLAAALKKRAGSREGHLQGILKNSKRGVSIGSNDSVNTRGRSNSPTDLQLAHNQKVIEMRQLQEIKDMKQVMERQREQIQLLEAENKQLAKEMKVQIDRLHLDQNERLQSLQKDHKKVVDSVLEEKIREVEKYRQQVSQMQTDLALSKSENQTQLNQTFNAEGFAAQGFKENKELRSLISRLEVEKQVLEKEAASNRALKNEVQALTQKLIEVETKNLRLYNDLELLGSKHKQLEQDCREKERRLLNPYHNPNRVNAVLDDATVLKFGNANTQESLEDSQTKGYFQKIRQAPEKQFSLTRKHTQASSAHNAENLTATQKCLAQAALIEKLVQENKKLKQEEPKKLKAQPMIEGHEIFESENKARLKMVKQAEVGAEEVEKEINEIYQILLQHSNSNQTLSKVKSKKLTYAEKVLEIKGYLNLQGQVGSLKQFKYDIDFAKLIDLKRFQEVTTKFSQEVGLNASEILYLKNTSFQGMSNLFSDTIGKFFVVYSRMLYHQKRSNYFEESLKRIKDPRVVPSSDTNADLEAVFKNEDDYDLKRDAIVNEIQSEMNEVMRVNDDLTAQLEVAKLQENTQMFEKVYESIVKWDLKATQTEEEPVVTPNIPKQKKSSIAANANPQTRKQNGNQATRQPLHKVFNGKRSWSRNPQAKMLDTDINEAIDRMEQMQKKIEQYEQDSSLHQMDIKHLKKENQQLAEQLEKESTAHSHLEQLKIEHQEKIKKQMEQITKLKSQIEKQDAQLEKLKNLNEEFQEVITQERKFNNEEIEMLEKDFSHKLKQADSKNIIVKNKLTQLANYMQIFVASSFNMEQMVDSILEYVMKNKIQALKEIKRRQYGLDKDQSEPPVRQSPMKKKESSPLRIKERSRSPSPPQQLRSKSNNRVPERQASPPPAYQLANLRIKDHSKSPSRYSHNRSHDSINSRQTLDVPRVTPDGNMSSRSILKEYNRDTNQPLRPYHSRNASKSDRNHYDGVNLNETRQPSLPRTIMSNGSKEKSVTYDEKPRYSREKEHQQRGDSYTRRSDTSRERQQQDLRKMKPPMRKTDLGGHDGYLKHSERPSDKKQKDISRPIEQPKHGMRDFDLPKNSEPQKPSHGMRDFDLPKQSEPQRPSHSMRDFDLPKQSEGSKPKDLSASFLARNASAASFMSNEGYQSEAARRLSNKHAQETAYQSYQPTQQPKQADTPVQLPSRPDSGYRSQQSQYGLEPQKYRQQPSQPIEVYQIAQPQPQRQIQTVQQTPQTQSQQTLHRLPNLASYQSNSVSNLHCPQPYEFISQQPLQQQTYTQPPRPSPQQNTSLEKEKRDFNEKLNRLRQKLKSKETEPLERTMERSSFLKESKSSPMNSKLENSINKRLRDFENTEAAK